LQAEALVKARELELVSARNEERSASRVFNSSRNIDSEHVQEILSEIDSTTINELKIPARATLRDDVKAAREAARAAGANAVMSTERNKPTLDLVGNLALNGQTGFYPTSDLSTSIANSASFRRPTAAIGFRFVMRWIFQP